MIKVNNSDFFKKPFSQQDMVRHELSGEEEQVKTAETDLNEIEPENFSPITISDDIRTSIRETIELLKSIGRVSDADKLEQIYRDASRDRFSVAVVGEFSKGKSTFINAFLGKKLLPVADLPTTAMLTRIRYNQKEMLILFDNKGKKVKVLPVSVESWDGLTAENFAGDDPEGTVLAGVNSRFLGACNLELIDTPGAGDLEEKRARIIGDALLSGDGAIITISATAALSLSEKLFIEQRLLARKTPFLMMIITKLDQVPKDQRSGIVDYVKSRLSLWKMDIPVYIPYNVEMDSEKYADITGMDKVKKQIAAWINDPQRVELTEGWLMARALSVLQTPISSLKEQRLLIEARESKRQELINEKQQKLSKAEIAWEDIRLKMLSRCKDCITLLQNKADEYKVSVTERLQYEASHSNAPQKWWTEDYPYRLKVELANVSAGIESIVSRRISDDAGWFNAALEQNFKSHVLYSKDTISDKELMGSVTAEKKLEFENIDKKRNIARVGTAALSIAACFVCASAGFLPIIATMGVGTGASIISESIFKGKIEKQREEIKAAIAKNVPEIIEESMSESEKRLTAVYDDIINAAVKEEASWMEAQKETIEKSIKPINGEEKTELDRRISALENLCSRFEGV